MFPMFTRREMLLSVAAAALAVPVFAADETLKGEMVCAKCYLKKADAKECQDVLLVKDAAGKTTEFYITKNDVAKAAGEACTQPVPAVITGTVKETDGRKWLTASKITKG
jgi:hypothetical protein